MSVFEIIAATFGFLIVGTTVWKLIRYGVARSNGNVPEIENIWRGAPPP